MKNLILMKPAEKYLNKQPAQTAGRILWAIYKLPKGDVVALQNRDGVFRLKVGDVRVIFEMDGNQFTICDIDNRGDVYK